MEEVDARIIRPSEDCLETLGERRGAGGGDGAGGSMSTCSFF